MVLPVLCGAFGTLFLYRSMIAGGDLPRCKQNVLWTVVCLVTFDHVKQGLCPFCLVVAQEQFVAGTLVMASAIFLRVHWETRPVFVPSDRFLPDVPDPPFPVALLCSWTCVFLAFCLGLHVLANVADQLH